LNTTASPSTPEAARLLARERAAKKDDPVEVTIEHLVTLSRTWLA